MIFNTQKKRDEERKEEKKGERKAYYNFTREIYSKKASSPL